MCNHKNDVAVATGNMIGGRIFWCKDCGRIKDEFCLETYPRQSSEHRITLERKFIVYPVEIVKFIEFTKRFQVDHDMSMEYAPREVDKAKSVDDEIIYTSDVFICTVKLDDDHDPLRFINCFSLFFPISRAVGY